MATCFLCNDMGASALFTCMTADVRDELHSVRGVCEVSGIQVQSRQTGQGS